MRYLLDKNVIRHAITGFRDMMTRSLLELELGALTFWQASERRAEDVFISEASFNILQTRLDYDEVIVFLDFVNVLVPSRYHARWARRIRESTGLSREDAAMIALATFGSNDSGKILGVHQLLTYDIPMINGFQSYHSTLEHRLKVMTEQLPLPFNQAALPEIMTPDQVLKKWAN